MESSTTLKSLLTDNQIYVPSYQRAYSWDTPSSSYSGLTQTDVFINDINEYLKSKTSNSYYFGHFLFEKKSEKKFAVIDGQQRLTTIIILISVLFKRIKSLREGDVLTEEEELTYEDMVKRRSIYRFSTVDYDNLIFKDYVIDQSKRDKNGLDTTSSKRIVNCFDYFDQYFSDKDYEYLRSVLDAVSGASCTTHQVNEESEAIQMFIFQNNRGKSPSTLELIKAQFMYHIHLYGDNESDDLMETIKGRFEKIYKSISSIEDFIHEDEVLLIALKIHFNSLWEVNSLERVNAELSKGDTINFIRLFSQKLSTIFDLLTNFFLFDQLTNIQLHSFVVLRSYNIGLPFILKAYLFNHSKETIGMLASSLESLLLRNRLVKTRADLTSRLNDQFKSFNDTNASINSILEHIKWMKEVDKKSWWWAYWNNDELIRAVNSGVSHKLAKFILWRYENRSDSSDKNGYSFLRYDQIENPELEHIAPQKPTNEEPLAAGYDVYDDEFKNEYLNSIGNYLLLSKSHNCSVGNIAFIEKRESYTHLKQQREIRDMTEMDNIWNRIKIDERKQRIIQFILDTF